MPNTTPTRKVPRYAVGLIVVGGAIWVFAALSGAITQRLSGIPSLGTSGGNGIVGYPPHAVSDLLWGGYIAFIFVAALGVIAILIGLTAFRNGERWSWFAMLTFLGAGTLNAIADGLEWGGWFTFLFYGLAPFLGVVQSIRGFFPGQPRSHAPSAAA